MSKYIFKKSHSQLISESIKSLKDFNGSYEWLPDGSDWGAGGCRILAEALSRLISDENDCLISVSYSSSRHTTSIYPVPQHVYVKCYLSSYECFIDYNGVQDREAFRRNQRRDLNTALPILGVYEPLQCDKHGIEASESSIQSTYEYLRDYLLSHRK